MKKILQQSSASIERLLQHSRYLEYLCKRLLTYLPTEFSDKISVLGFSTYFESTSSIGASGASSKGIPSAHRRKQHNLIIAAISAPWASKLRFYIPTLKRSLMAEPQFSQLNKIVIRVATNNVNIKKERKMPVYSSSAADIIQNSAQHIKNDDLKNALMRLAHNVGKNGS